MKVDDKIFYCYGKTENLCFEIITIVSSDDPISAPKFHIFCFVGAA